MWRKHSKLQRWDTLATSKRALYAASYAWTKYSKSIIREGIYSRWAKCKRCAFGTDRMPGMHVLVLYSVRHLYAWMDDVSHLLKRYMRMSCVSWVSKMIYKKLNKFIYSAQSQLRIMESSHWKISEDCHLQKDKNTSFRSFIFSHTHWTLHSLF